MAMSERYLSLTFSSTKINWTRNLFNQRMPLEKSTIPITWWSYVCCSIHGVDLSFSATRVAFPNYHILRWRVYVSQRSTFIVEHHSLLLRWIFSRFKSQLGLANCRPNRHRALNRVKNSGFQPFFSLSLVPLDRAFHFWVYSLLS